MEIQILRDPVAVAGRAADVIVSEARASVSARGRFIIAFSGGQTPAPMLRALADREMPWAQTFIFQVDERAVPDGDSERNLSRLRENLIDRIPLPSSHLYAMPVEEPDLETATKLYSRSLENIAGEPATLDCIHLGLGKDGHTASLVPGDPVLDVTGADVAATGIYQKTRRLTLTFRILNRARKVVWLVAGNDKAVALARLLSGDTTIPAGRVRQDRAIVLTDVQL